ncbi:MAG TPA: glutamine-hydrolyzing carbamoyl-phosphate synthase small subunit [Ktedonobacterales bacterium]
MGAATATRESAMPERAMEPVAEPVAEPIVALALEDGAVFYGRPFGAVDALANGRRGEVVFATPMTGYQEICTDPSYRGQMVVLTYPLVGNYGVAREDVESRRPWLSALLVREYCAEYSNWRAGESLDAYLARSGIPGVADLDTRALTRHLRDHGTQRGILRLVPADALAAGIDEAALVAEAQTVRSVSDLDVVGEVGLPAIQPWQPMLTNPTPSLATARPTSDRPRVVLIDTGYKENIARCLNERGLEVVLAPHNLDLDGLLRLDPDGVLLANGPGDPESERSLVALVRALLAREEVIPLMGICLGHQILGLAAGATTSRLPFGHHGANHPVLERATGRVTITAQNHNFQVDENSLPPESGFRVSHVNLSDGSVEGLEHASLPVFSVQYHPEACPGPEDNRALFDRFAGLVAGAAQRQGELALVG